MRAYQAVSQPSRTPRKPHPRHPPRHPCWTPLKVQCASSNLRFAQKEEVHRYVEKNQANTGEGVAGWAMNEKTRTMSVAAMKMLGSMR